MKRKNFEMIQETWGKSRGTQSVVELHEENFSFRIISFWFWEFLFGGKNSISVQNSFFFSSFLRHSFANDNSQQNNHLIFLFFLISFSFLFELFFFFFLHRNGRPRKVWKGFRFLCRSHLVWRQQWAVDGYSEEKPCCPGISHLCRWSQGVRCSLIFYF